MIYFVSGYMRSGTSMMMKALIAGGMKSAYSPDRDRRMHERWGEKSIPNGYTPNKEYFELDLSDYLNPDFPHAHEGKLVKCLWGGLSRMRNCQARVVFMRRPRDEVYDSMLAAFGHVPDIVANPGFDTFMDKIVEAARDRRSFVSFDEIDYEAVLDDPLRVFQQLQWNGWPIDPYAAASVPKRSEKRYAA